MSGIGGGGPLDALRAEPEWSGVFDRVAAALQGKAAPAEDPGAVADGGPVSCLESYARAVSGASSPGVSLALTLPMALTVGSVAGQGAYWTRIVGQQGNRLDVPMIVQSTLIAPSGYGKSTSLEPLVGMLDRLDRQGHGRRSKIITEHYAAVAKALEDQGVPLAGEADLEKIKKIYNSGKCKRLTLDSGTPEGVRRTLLRGGGCTGILTAEPDILQEISKYSKDGSGTFRYLLDGWGGAKIGVARGEREMVIPRAVLPYCIVVQPVAFEQFNAQRAEKNAGGLASDSAIGRGLYGRSWLARVEGFAGVGPAYGLPSEETAGLVNGVAGAAIAVESALEKVMIRSDEYRAAMGVLIGWEEASSQDAESVMEAPKLPARLWLGLAADAQWPFVQVQNMRLAMIELVQQLEAGAVGAERLLMPMVTRWTQHVLRLAQVLTLTVDPAAVDIGGWAVRDASLRLGPWLLEHWCAEMYRYQEAATVALLEQEVRNNKSGDDLTFEGRIIAAMVALRDESGLPGDEMVWGRLMVIEKAKRRTSSMSRAALTGPLSEAFAGIVKKGWLSEIVTAPSGGKGRPVVRYKRTGMGQLAGL